MRVQEKGARDSHDLYSIYFIKILMHVIELYEFSNYLCKNIFQLNI